MPKFRVTARLGGITHRAEIHGRNALDALVRHSRKSPWRGAFSDFKEGPSVIIVEKSDGVAPIQTLLDQFGA